LIGTNPLSTSDTRASILAALERAGWQIDDVRDDRVETSDGERYGLAVFLEAGTPVEICYGDGEEDLQFCEEWHEAPGILAPEEVARLFGDEEGEER
jgi:hypothetical protein